MKRTGQLTNAKTKKYEKQCPECPALFKGNHAAQGLGAHLRIFHGYVGGQPPKGGVMNRTKIEKAPPAPAPAPTPTPAPTPAASPAPAPAPAAAAAVNGATVWPDALGPLGPLNPQSHLEAAIRDVSARQTIVRQELQRLTDLQTEDARLTNQMGVLTTALAQLNPPAPNAPTVFEALGELVLDHDAASRRE